MIRQSYWFHVDPIKIQIACTHSNVEKSALNGINNGLQMLLDAETFDYASPFQGREGFTFAALHHMVNGGRWGKDISLWNEKQQHAQEKFAEILNTSTLIISSKNNSN